MKGTLTIVSLLALAGCGGAGTDGSHGDNPAPNSPTVPARGSASTLPSGKEVVKTLELNPEMEVATIDFGKDHFVRFLEVVPGDVLMLETAPIPEKPRAFPEGIPSTKSWLEIYRTLAPDVEPPIALVEADRRSKARAAQIRPDQGTVSTDTPATTGVTAPGDTRPDTLLPGSTLRPLDNTPPGWDWNADAQWFLSNFCQGGGGVATWCPTNVGWASGGHYYANWAQSTGLCAQFDTSQGVCNFMFWHEGFFNFGAGVSARHWIQYTYNGAGNFYSEMANGYPAPYRIDFAKRIIP